MWCIQEITPAYERNMLDVLGVYERSYNPDYPVVCFDEKSKQLLLEVRSPIYGKLQKHDYEYERNGVVNLFVTVEPKGNKRYVFVTKHRTKKEFARAIKLLVSKIYKKAKKIILVTDNLNIHKKQTLLEALGVKEGRRLCRKIEWHYTPKHASWLNQAEIAIHSLSTQCLNKRIPTFQAMQHETAIWVKDRNSKRDGINWNFTRAEAKEKFKLA